MTTIMTMPYIVGIMIAIITLFIIAILWHMLRTPSIEEYVSTIDGKEYKIVSSFGDLTHQKAADILAHINAFVTVFIEHLTDKYTANADINTNEYQITIQRRRIVNNLVKRYDADNLQENNPVDTGSTSFVINKGDQISFCLRDKNTNFKTFHDINSIQFVVLHELAHIGCDEYGHTDNYWKTFGFLLHEAYDAGIYQPVDYSNPEHRMNYCGIDVTVNPFFVKNMNIQ